MEVILSARVCRYIVWLKVNENRQRSVGKQVITISRIKLAKSLTKVGNTRASVLFIRQKNTQNIILWNLE